MFNRDFLIEKKRRLVSVKFLYFSTLKENLSQNN